MNLHFRSTRWLVSNICLALGILAPAFIEGAAPSAPQGMITAREYLDLGPETTVASLTSSAKFPEAPDVVAYPTLFEWPSNPDGSLPLGDVKNYYGIQIVGYLYPPVTGDYVFAIASDDQSELYLSTDDSPAKKVLIAREPQWNPQRAFGAATRRALVDAGTAEERRENVSKKTRLSAGRPYYVEALGKEGPGAENLAVAWAKPGERLPRDGDAPIPGTFLSTIDRANLGAPYVAGFSFSYTGVRFLLEDGAGIGAAAVNPNSVQLQFDSLAVVPQISRSGTTTTAVYEPPALLTANSAHTAKVEFADSRGTKHGAEQSFTVPPYLSLPAGFAVRGVDTNKPGFKARVYQVFDTHPNTLVWTEEELAGLHGENLANLAGVGRDGYFVLADVINLSQTGGENNGNFRPDLQMPGIPGTTGGDDNIALEILTFLELPKGVITMGVNSDDGFRVAATAGAKDVFAMTLGEFNGGRGASDTLFTFVTEAAGIYPFRLIYQDGQGGASLEWFTVDSAGQKMLINDLATPGAIRAYREGPPGGLAYLQSYSPTMGAQDQPARPRISAVLIDGSNQVDPKSVKLSVDRTRVEATVFKAGARTTVNYSPATNYVDGSEHKVTLYFADFGMPPASRTVEWSFSTRIPESIFIPGTLFIEAEDFNFGRGSYIHDQPIGMNGKYVGGAYQDKGDGIGGVVGDGSGFGVDYFEVNPGNDQAVYRPTTAVEAARGGTTLNPPPAGLNRGLFSVQVNYVVGWNDPGDWLNYTRLFPPLAKDYAVYARLASGAAAEWARLDEITAGAKTTQQTLKKLGTFKAQATGSWDTYHIVQLKDDAGQPVRVNLRGERTLRFTILPGNLDLDYLAFVPPLAAEFTFIKMDTGQIVVEWTGKGTLQSADSLAGEWTDVADATSPMTIPASSLRKFYRLKH